MDTLSSPIRPVEYSCFYAMDRALYSLLAIELWRNPHESVHIVALWLWLERLGHTNIVQRILSLPRIVINELADEASVCLRCIKDPQFQLSVKATDIPLTRSLLKKKISLKTILENRDSVIEGVRKVIAEVCASALSDVIQQATKRHAAHNLVKSQKRMSPSLEQSLAQSFASLGFVGEMPNGTTDDKGVPPPVEQSLVCSSSNLGLGGETPGGSIPGNLLAPEDRTLFVTFSKGYPVQESEVREFFINLFGDCIASFYMQPVMPNEQALYARVEFNTPSVIDALLNGLRKAKYTINGKHLWMRKYVAKRASFPPSQFQPPPV